MKANEIMRGVLDLLDRIDCDQAQQPAQISIAGQAIAEPEVIAIDIPVEEPPQDYNDETRRFRQISDILSTKNRNTMYSNSPNEMIASPTSVTVDAGGGENGPKHPSDLRTNSISLYPK
jgi:hypothetical protein